MRAFEPVPMSGFRLPPGADYGVSSESWVTPSPRDLNAKLVEWKYTSSGVGRREPIEPAPVQLEIVGFPGGQDVFNPKFWEGLRCPAVAVQ